MSENELAFRRIDTDEDGGIYIVFLHFPNNNGGIVVWTRLADYRLVSHEQLKIMTIEEDICKRNCDPEGGGILKITSCGIQELRPSRGYGSVDQQTLNSIIEKFETMRRKRTS